MQQEPNKMKPNQKDELEKKAFNHFLKVPDAGDF